MKGSNWAPLFAVALLLSAAEASSETSAHFPPHCRPVGSIYTCSSAVPAAWAYSTPLCTGDPDRTTEQAAALDLYNAVFSPANCSTTVTASGGWLSGGPYSMQGCGTSTNYPSLPYLDVNTNIELKDFRPYLVQVVSTPPACASSNQFTHYVSRTRERVCPLGMTADFDGLNVVNGTSYSALYCRNNNESKNYGRGCGAGSCVGNPINPGTGNKFQRESDYESVDGSLRFERFYNSTGNRYAQTKQLGPDWFTRIGSHWRHTYDRSITLITSATLTTAFAYREDGKIVTFNLYSNVFYADPDVTGKLTRVLNGSGVPVGWKYTDSNDAVELYDIDGKLLSITERSLKSQVLQYDASQRLSTVTDHRGRVLTLTYNGDGRIDEVQDPAGGVYSYHYDTAGNLTSVEHPSGTTRSYWYNELGFPAFRKHQPKLTPLTIQTPLN